MSSYKQNRSKVIKFNCIYLSFAGPSLNYARHAAACGIITWTNPSNGTRQQFVVVAGGANWNAGKILKFLNIIKI
jgi:hypothetical protein